MIHQGLQIQSAVHPESGSQWSEIGAVMDDYLRLKDEYLLGQIKSIGPLLDDWILNRNRFAETNRLTGTNFNPLPRLKINETMHSRILGDLLDPNGTHGQKNLFLLPLLEELGIPYPEDGLWHVTVEAGRVDILIWREPPRQSAVIIENKSNGAVDQPNQIYRYWHQEMFLWKPELWESTDEAKVGERKRNFHVVYLTTGGGKSPESHSMERPVGLATVNHFERVPLEPCTRSLAELIALWEKNAIPRIPPENHRLRSFLSQYQELWTT